MNSLLDGYNEKTVYNTKNTDTVSDSLLDGYVEPKQPNVPKENVPEAGLVPMAQRIGTGLVQGVKNLPSAIVDFTKQGVQAGKQEFTEGYNPVEAFTSASLGAIQGAGNLAEGIWNLPGDLVNTYYGQEKIKPTQPLTKGIPDLIAKTQYGRDYLEGVKYLQDRYPLANMLSQEIGEEIPGMLAGATLAKYGLKAGKLAKTADKISDVGYGKLARSSALGGLGEGFIIDPAQGQDLTPDERLAGRFTNAYSGAVIAPALNVGIKAGVDVAPKAVEVGTKAMNNGVNAVKSVSAQIVKSFDDMMNTPTSFDMLREINQNVGNKVSPAVISNARIRNLNNDLRSYANLLDTAQTGEYLGQRLDENQLKAVKRHLYKLEDSFKSQNEFINQNINKLDLDTLSQVQSNLQGRFEATPIKDGYNVYGVPVAETNIDKFNAKYEKYNTQAMLDRIQQEQRARLEAYKQKLIDEGKIKQPIIDEVPDSLLDGYNEPTVNKVPEIENNGLTEDIEGVPENTTPETVTDNNNIENAENGIDLSKYDEVGTFKTWEDAITNAQSDMKTQEQGKRKIIKNADGSYTILKEKELIKPTKLQENPENIKIDETSETPKVSEENSAVKKYKYDIGNMATKNGLDKFQREYIAKTILDEYKGDLYTDIKNLDHIFDTEKNPRIEVDKYLNGLKNDDMINLFIPNTNAKFTIYKNPYAIRKVLDKLGIKLQENIEGIEKYTNKANPALNKFDLKVYDGTYISDGFIAVKPELVNIKNPDIIKQITNNEVTQGYNAKISKLFPQNVKPLTDTNLIGDTPAKRYNSSTGKWEDIPNKRTKVRIFEKENGSRIYIDEKYAKIFDDYRLHQGDSDLSAVVAKNATGDDIGLVMPTQMNKAEVENIVPYKKQSVFDKKVYKDIAVKEPAVTNWGKHKYDKTQEKAFSKPRVKLETETQAISRVKKRQKAENAKNLKDAKAYNRVLKEGIREWDSQIRTRQYDVGKDLTEFINKTENVGKEWKMNGTNLREIMPFLRERTGIPENLNRPDLKELFNKLTDIQKRKLTDMADELSEKFEKYWKEYQSTHADETNEGSKEQIENYITHIWDLDRKQKSLMTNYFATRSRFAKERTIKTLFDGIQGIKMENGEVLKLQPKVLDYAQILQVQADNLIKTTFDKVLADEVKGFKTYNGTSLVMPASKAPSDWVTINHPALNKAIIRPIDSTVGEVITPELQNILAEMGVAIGRRINPRANYLGVYKHKIMRPEIALQRWFSNKTLAHEIGHAIDHNLHLREKGFASRYKNELLELNEERIKALSKNGKGGYAKSDAELIAEFFGFFFNDPKLTQEIAPNATMEIIETLSKNETLKKLLPENFDWENAKHTMEQATTEMFKMAVKVHPDIADTLKTVFDNVGERTTFGKFFDNTNSFLKQAQLGFSGFHAVALSEANFANNGVSRAMKALNPVKLFNAVKNNDWDIYKKDKIAKDAIESGLQIGATLDINRGLVEGMVDDAGRWIENKVPVLGKPFSLPVKYLAKGQKLNNKVLWDYLHNNYKLDTYEMLLNEESKRGIVSKAKKQEIAHWVNDSFGGQVWENLGIKSGQRQFEQRALLSPDWLRSTTRQALGVLSTERGHKLANYLAKKSEFWENAKKLGQEWGIHSLTDDVTATGMRGRIARRFWVRAVIQYSIYTNVLNAMFREKDRKEHPELYPKKMTAKDYSTYGNSKGNETYVFLGRNSDGTERYWRLGKQFREMPELVEKPIEKIGGKASPMAQLVSQTFTNKSVGGFENPDLKDKKGLERIPALGAVYAKSVLPFSLNPIVNTNKDFTPYDFFAPTSRGLTFYKGRELYIDAIKRGDKEEIKLITSQLKRNNLNPDDIAKSAIKEIRKEVYKKAYKKAEDLKRSKK